MATVSDLKRLFVTTATLFTISDVVLGFVTLRYVLLDISRNCELEATYGTRVLLLDIFMLDHSVELQLLISSITSITLIAMELSWIFTTFVLEGISEGTFVLETTRVFYQLLKSLDLCSISHVNSIWSVYILFMSAQA